MLGGGILATEGTVYLLLEFFFVDLPLRPALVITFVVTILVTPPQLFLFASALTSMRRSRNPLHQAKMDHDQRVEQRTRELSEEVESRSRAEVALRKSENLRRLITDALPVYIAYIDADGRYRFANKSHE